MDSIRTLHEKLQSREITAVSLLNASFNAIDDRNSEISAIVHEVDRDAAYAEARRLDERFDAGDDLHLLAGIPFTAKDAFNVKGALTTAGADILDGYISPYTATAVERLLDVGAIYIGKTNQDCFGFGSSTEHSDLGVTKNPHDLSKVAGGSSGGSAAAVATGMGVFSLGEDTGGSIRQPACFNGTVGLKVTYGAVSRYGVVAYASSLDTIGPITRTVDDAAIVLACIAGRDVKDATTLENYIDVVTTNAGSTTLEGKVFGVPKEFVESITDQEIRDNFEAAVKNILALGGEVKDVSLPLTKYGVSAYYLLAPSEASSNLSRYDGMRFGKSVRDGDRVDSVFSETRGNSLNAEAKRRVLLGTYALSSGYYDAFFDKAQRVRTLMKEDMEKSLEGIDAIVAPVSPVLPFEIDADFSDDPTAMWALDAFTLPVNVAGVPALSIPTGISNKNLPMGVQFIGKQKSEALLLSLGAVYERTYSK